MPKNRPSWYVLLDRFIKGKLGQSYWPKSSKGVSKIVPLASHHKLTLRSFYNFADFCKFANTQNLLLVFVHNLIIKGVLYSILGPDLVGLTVAVWNIVARCLSAVCTNFWCNWTKKPKNNKVLLTVATIKQVIDNSVRPEQPIIIHDFSFSSMKFVNDVALIIIVPVLHIFHLPQGP